MTIHTVTSGETLFSIGEKYNLSIEYIPNINLLPNPDNLVIGQTIVILYPETTHMATPYDSIDSIATKYGVSKIQLQRNNPFLATRSIEVGDIIVIAFKRNPLGTAEINGYVYPFIDLDYLPSVLPSLTYITIFTYGSTRNGKLIDIDDERIISLARSYGVAPIMHLSSLSAEGIFSSALASEILNSPFLQNILIENILFTLTQKKYHGLDIDFEFIPSEDAEKYVDFVAKLRRALNSKGFILITALAPKTSSDQAGILYEGHDYEGIGHETNIAFIMTYEWGYTYGPPMAVAPINKVKEVIDYAVTEIPSKKILMGIPSYGYIWTLPYVSGITKATSISNVTALNIAAEQNAEILYDSLFASPYFYFTDTNGTPCVVWFEDARSIEEKLKIITEYNLLGAGYWNLDRPFPQNWTVLNAMYNILQVPVVI